MKYESPIINIKYVAEDDIIRTSGLIEGDDFEHIDPFLIS